MASSVGPRARGTDGSDYLHRERVANHYTVSAEIKPKLRKVLQLQILCALLCLGLGLIDHYDIVFLLTFSGYLLGIPFCYLALKRNNSTYMNLYGCCCSILGVFPMVYLLYTSLWTGLVPDYRYLKLLLAAAVVLCNTTGMYFAKKLMEAWTATTNRRLS